MKTVCLFAVFLWEEYEIPDGKYTADSYRVPYCCFRLSVPSVSIFSEVVPAEVRRSQRIILYAQLIWPDITRVLSCKDHDWLCLGRKRINLLMNDVEGKSNHEPAAPIRMTPATVMKYFKSLHNLKVKFYLGQNETAAWETGFQIALRNCHEELNRGARVYGNFATKGRWEQNISVS